MHPSRLLNLPEHSGGGLMTYEEMTPWPSAFIAQPRASDKHRQARANVSRDGLVVSVLASSARGHRHESHYDHSLTSLGVTV